MNKDLFEELNKYQLKEIEFKIGVIFPITPVHRRNFGEFV